MCVGASIQSADEPSCSVPARVGAGEKSAPEKIRMHSSDAEMTKNAVPLVKRGGFFQGEYPAIRLQCVATTIQSA
jgi:hypothetical protein